MKKGISLIILCLFVFVGVRGDSQYKYINSWDTDVYFGHVIYPEAKHDGKDAVVLREGQSRPEVADLNLPLAPGDTVKTGERRCEIQFDTGTVIRLDRDSELKIETILAQSLSSKNQLTNLLLKRGQAFVMYKRYVRKEMFQIITPSAAVKLDHKSVAMIHVKPEGSTDVVIKEGKAHMLYGSNENAINTEIVKKPRMITVTAGHKMVRSQYEPLNDFEEWNKKINNEFLDLHEEKAVIPLPIQRLPEAIFYFAQQYGSLHGEWLWDRYCGYVWRPFLNDHAYPGGGNWMPYFHGRWTSVQGQLFWVPYERWGWVPYHLGIWMWNKKKGWLWIPGSVFAPAWVDWTFYGDSFCWRPWMLMDWYGYGLYRAGQLPYFAYLIYPGEDQQIEPGPPGSRENLPRKVLTKDQLKSTKSAPYPMPKEFKKTYERVVLALQKGEDWVLSPLKDMPNHMLVVSQKDLNAPRIHEKAVKLSSLSEETNKVFLLQRPLIQHPSQVAEQAYLRNEKMATLHEKINGLMRDLEGLKDLEVQAFQLSDVIVDSKSQNKNGVNREEKVLQLSGAQAETSSRKQTSPPDRSAPRFRDWNPDVKAARRAGISIRYSSRSNEVRCPELNISSRNVSGSRGYDGPRVRLTSRGSVAASGSSGAVYSGSSSSSSSSRGGSSSSATSNTGSKGAGSGGASGGKVKK
jgi:hypothetical protein